MPIAAACAGHRLERRDKAIAYRRCDRAGHGRARAWQSVPVPSQDENHPWYSVRCLFAFTQDDGATYEERVTIWGSGSFDAAIALAEHEAKEYADSVEAHYIGLAQSYHLAVDDRPLGDGDEVFSLMRASELSPDEYITRFFDTGCESQQTTG